MEIKLPDTNLIRVRHKQNAPQAVSSDEQRSIPGFKILIAHRPELIDIYEKYPFDLVVSGHAHGGQIRIPFLLNELIAPNQGRFPKYAGGVYQHGGLTHIVSRGLSFSLYLPRVFDSPEVVVIDISK